MNNHLTDR